MTSPPALGGSARGGAGAPYWLRLRRAPTNGRGVRALGGGAGLTPCAARGGARACSEGAGGTLGVFPPGSLPSPSRVPSRTPRVPSACSLLDPFRVFLPGSVPRLPPKPLPAALASPPVPVSRLPRLASPAHTLLKILSGQDLVPQRKVRAAKKGEAAESNRFCHVYCLSRPFSVAVENGNVEMCNFCGADEVFPFSSVIEGAELLWLPVSNSTLAAQNSRAPHRHSPVACCLFLSWQSKTLWMPFARLTGGRASASRALSLAAALCAGRAPEEVGSMNVAQAQSPNWW